MSPISLQTSSKLAHWQENDTTAQEATPEELRIAIDDAFRKFSYSDKMEFTFPSDLNNLQRKYIHEKAKMMNLISKSHGKEPNRQLSIYKKKTSETSGTCTLELCKESSIAIDQVLSTYHLDDFKTTYKSKVSQEKVFGRIFSSPPVDVPLAYVPRDIEKFKKTLPITHMRQKIMECIISNQVTIISSETGSGKTTQIPQFILEEFYVDNKVCRIICTQPRRISTVAVAERVSRERGDHLGNSVGYHIRLESKLSLKTNLIYCTNGVLIRSLMSDDSLSQITHVIIDEVHERDRQSDFLLICLKKALPNYPNLKLILMSATVNIEKFKSYFESAEVLQVPGRTYNIQQYFLDDILQITEYMSSKMQSICLSDDEIEVPEVTGNKKLVEMDTAINDCLRNNTQEAWGQMLVYILTENLPVNYQHSHSGLTPLMVAAMKNNVEHINVLRGVNADLSLKCYRGRTALDWAHYYNNREAVDQLTHQFIKQTPKDKLLEYYIKSVTDDLIDFELLTHVIVYIHKGKEPGAILVFLPGYDDIMLLSEYIAEALRDTPQSFQTFHLHGGMNIGDQHAIFTHLQNKRKIILSTNIAETSITINDVKFVVDSGKAKEKTFDSYTGLCALQTNWISKACVKQRAGRAGRTSDGYCFHIFSKQRYNHFQSERTPEILRVPLESLCLNTKVIAPNIPLSQFFAMAPDPPSTNLVRAAIESLIALGAMDDKENLTPLGEYLGQLTIDPHMGKMLIYSVIFKCVDPVLTLVSIMTQKDPFQLPAQSRLKGDAGSKRKSLSRGVPSDHVIYLRAFQIWQEHMEKHTENDFLRDYYIGKTTMDSALMIRGLFLGQLRAAGFVGPRGPHSIQDVNVNSGNWALVKAVIASGLYPRLAYYQGNQLRTRFEKSVSLSTYSCISNQQMDKRLWFIFDELVKARSSAALRGVTAITPITIALICGNSCESLEFGKITVDEWLDFEVSTQGIMFLRKCLNAVIAKILASSENVLHQYEETVIKTVARVLQAEDENVGLNEPPDIGQRPRFLERVMPKHVTRRQNRHTAPRTTSSESSIGTFNLSDHLTNGDMYGGYRSVNNQYNKGRNYRPARNNFPARNTVTGLPLDTPGTSNSVIPSNSSYKNYSSSISSAESLAYSTNGVAGFSGGVDLVSSNVCDSNFSSDTSSLLFSGDSQNSTRLPSSFNGLPFLNFNRVALNDNLNGFGAYRVQNDANYIKSSDDTVYLLIRPRQASSVSIAYETSKWVFAPHTQKKILSLVNQQKKVKLIFRVHDIYFINGIAEFVCMEPRNEKPEALIRWIHKPEISYNFLGFANDVTLFDGVDGQEIDKTLGDELCNRFSRVLSICTGLD